MKTRKKLIEVALPLEAINKASAREKSIRHGHPSTLHLWWARRPLAAARAVIFAQMTDDPSSYVDTLLGDPKTRRAAERDFRKRRELWLQRKAEYEAATGNEDVAVPEPGLEPTLADCAAEIERDRLFRIIEELVLWENTTNEAVLERARAEIWQSWRRACADNADHPRAKELFDRNRLPAFHDPFAGGGALPLEAQRLGLEAHATDLNPVAVLINKAMIEIPPKFAGKPPVNPEAQAEIARTGVWNGKGADGLSDDVRYYGRWIRDEAEKRIGHLYPKVKITQEMASGRPDLVPLVGRELTVIAWLWARTVKCPNPGCGLKTPLLTSFVLSSRRGKEAYLVPSISGGLVSFRVSSSPPAGCSAPDKGLKRGTSGIFECLGCGVVTERDYVAAEGKAGRIGLLPTAIIAIGLGGRIYLETTLSECADSNANSIDLTGLDIELSANPRDIWCRNFGLLSPKDLFTTRQLVALTTLCDLTTEARNATRNQALAAGMPDDGVPLREGGLGASAYGDAVSVYLGLAVDKACDYNSSLVLWSPTRDQAKTTFSRQALPMTWDFAETNMFANAAGDIGVSVEGICRTLSSFGSGEIGYALARDSRDQSTSLNKVVSTDPPYFDNIGYADLSDFFYVWLRRSLRSVFPELFATLAVPKGDELVATAYRHGSKQEAESFFLDGMTRAIRRIAEQAHPAFPVTIYYAFKQSETKGKEGVVSTGWETFLDAVIRSGSSVMGTWPMRTERGARSIGIGTSALASSIVLVCRPRAIAAPTATRREFLDALKVELPVALAHLQRGNIAPVDLAQASIGPGMAIYTRYSKVVDAAGKPLSVGEALALINETLDEVLAAQEGDFDADSRWAVAWFEQFGFTEGEYGVAETLSKAKNTSVAGMVAAGVVASKNSKVRLLKPSELPEDWDPATDSRLTAWETVHQLVRVLEAEGEAAAARLTASLGAKAEPARELAYRLYAISERKKRAAEALSYNSLVQSWPEISRLAREASAAAAEPSQTELFGGN